MKVDSKYSSFCITVLAAIGPCHACISFNAKPPGIPYISSPLGPRYPNDTVYVPYNASLYHLALANDDGGYDDVTRQEECRQSAAALGAQVFSYVDGTCMIANLNFPLCRARTGGIPVYVHENFLSDGDTHDHAVLGNHKSSLFSQMPEVSFRVPHPTIFDFAGFYTPLTSNSQGLPATQDVLPNNFVILTDEGSLATVSDRILVDPVCYTESSCGVPFFTSSSDVPDVPLIFHNVCGQKLTLRYGMEFHLVSHSCIGCEYFPDDYPEPYCPVRYRGFAPVKIRASLVNFAGEDDCDGFTLDVVAVSNVGVRNKTSLCRGPEFVEITATGGRGKIVFGGSAITRRKKYGFVIKLSY